MNKLKVAYWLVTGLMSLLFLGGASMYFANHGQVEIAFTNLGFPTWLIYPLGVAKVLGVVAVVSRRSALLKDMAYAGFVYDVLLAAAAHVMVGDGQFAPALVGLVLTVSSWALERRVFAVSEASQASA